LSHHVFLHELVGKIIAECSGKISRFQKNVNDPTMDEEHNFKRAME
jgi:hypothetical protein